jgi:hypothetical protein
MENEVFIGGVESVKLKRGMVAGYNVYATSRRLIGVKKRGKAIILRSIAPLADLAGSKEKSDIAIEKLQELKKDFELVREDISGLEIKKPPRFGPFQTSGHLRIMTKAGQDIKIKMETRQDFERVKEIISKFMPEALKVV